MPGIFISHTHGDRPLADGFRDFIDEVFGANTVAVKYSSSKESDHGIGPGDDWFRWIVEQVRDTDAAVVLLTPASVQKPWILWEAGAVAGAAYAKDLERARVYPMTFGLRSADVPTPFANAQVLSGTDVADVQKLCDTLLDRFAAPLNLSPSKIGRAVAKSGAAAEKFTTTAASALLRLPHVVTEAAIQEWLVRLNEIRSQLRVSETPTMENWLDVAFGREETDRLRPLDVRIHRTLGDLYATAGRAIDAGRQFALARQLSPRDIFLLRRLGKALLDQKDHDGCARVLEDIRSLDARAFERNVETAALMSRWQEDGGDSIGACETLQKAYANLPSSYYLGDRLGQLLVARDEISKAREVYRQVLQSVHDLRERNVWTEATALNAAIVCDDRDASTEAARAIAALEPSYEELQSIERGAAKLLNKLDMDQSLINALRNAAERR